MSEADLPVVDDLEPETKYFHEVTLQGHSFTIPLVHSVKLGEVFSAGENALLSGMTGKPLIVATALCHESLSRHRVRELPGKSGFDPRAVREKTRSIVKNLHDLHGRVHLMTDPRQADLVWDAYESMTSFLKRLEEMPNHRSQESAFRKEWRAGWHFHRPAFSYSISKLLEDTLDLPQVRILDRLTVFQRDYFRITVTPRAILAQVNAIKGPRKRFMNKLIRDLLTARWVQYGPDVDPIRAEAFLQALDAVLGHKIRW